MNGKFCLALVSAIAILVLMYATMQLQYDVKHLNARLQNLEAQHGTR